MKKVTKIYLHSDKDDNRYKAGLLGCSEEAIKKFRYALYEIEVSVEVDTETGEYKILEMKDLTVQ